MSVSRERNYVGVFDGTVGFGTKPALVIIDFTLAYTTPGSAFYGEGVVNAVRDTVPLLAAARAAGIPVIHTKVMYHASGADGGSRREAPRCGAFFLAAPGSAPAVHRTGPRRAAPGGATSSAGPA